MTEPRIQCEKRPWKVSTNPHDIPNGYDVEQHRGLTTTIAEPGSLAGLGGTLRLMACHESHNTPCAGWLMHQLGPGNNLPLRMRVATGRVDANVELVGPQHDCLEDTLPRRS